MERGTSEAGNDAGAQAQALGMSDEQADHLWGLRHRALYRCRLSTLYHRRRERFFDWLDKANNAVALIGGSAAFAAAADPAAVSIAALAVTVAGAMALVFGLAEKARRHAALAESYKRIEAEIVRAGEYDFTEAQVNGWLARVAETEGAEPPPLRPLVVLCQNDIAVSSNQLDKVTELPAYQRWLAQWVDFEVNAGVR